ncbi:MAG TPA: PRC-barrel domain-containing protein [Noviherbaspirillum sp.]
MKAMVIRQFETTLLAVAMACTPGLPALAQGPGQASSPAQAAIAALGGPDMRASRLLGADIRTTGGENVGKLQDLIVDVTSGRVHYAVLSYDDTPGANDKLFVFPIGTFKPAGGADQLVLDIDKDKLGKAPRFDRKRWPDLSNKRFHQEIERHFGAGAAQAMPRGQRLARASELIGRHVDDRAGARAGEIEDLVVNPVSERLRYVVLDMDKAWSRDDMLVTLPLGAFRFPERKGRDLVLEMTREEMEPARRFEENAWPNLNGRFFRREVDAFLARFQKDREGRQSGAERSSGGSR